MSVSSLTKNKQKIGVEGVKQERRIVFAKSVKLNQTSIFQCDTISLLICMVTARGLQHFLRSMSKINNLPNFEGSRIRTNNSNWHKKISTGKDPTTIPCLTTLLSNLLEYASHKQLEW